MKIQNIRSYIQDQILLLDGAMGTMLQARGLKTGENPEVLNLTAPEVVKEVHTAYLKSGSNVILTNTFGANPHKLERTGYSTEQVIEAAVALAREAAAPFGALVALDMGSLGELLEPMGSLSFEDAYEMFRRQVVQGVKSGVDLICIETMADLYEVKAALLAAKENSSLPVFCTMTFEQNFRTYTGCSIASMASVLEGLGADAIGINCSLGPFEIYRIAQELAKWTTLPLIVKPNAGLPQVKDGVTTFGITAEEFGKGMERFLELGVTVMGGCCGTNPEYIAAIKQAVEGKKPACRKGPPVPVLCVPTKALPVQDLCTVGTRFCPDKTLELREALLEGDLDTAAETAIEQMDLRVQALKVRAAVPGTAEEELLPAVVRELQSVANLPLILSAERETALEKALRVINGSCGIFCPEEKELDILFPLAQKYGASLLIPVTGDSIDFASSVWERASGWGLPKRKLFFLCPSPQEVSILKKLGYTTALEGKDSAAISQAAAEGVSLLLLNPTEELMEDVENR